MLPKNTMFGFASRPLSWELVSHLAFPLFFFFFLCLYNAFKRPFSESMCL